MGMRHDGMQPRWRLILERRGRDTVGFCYRPGKSAWTYAEAQPTCRHAEYACLRWLRDQLRLSRRDEVPVDVFWEEEQGC